MWGSIICGLGPFIHWGPRPEPRKVIAEEGYSQVQNSLGTQSRTIQSSACPRSPWKEGQKRYRNSLEKI